MGCHVRLAGRRGLGCRLQARCERRRGGAAQARGTPRRSPELTRARALPRANLAALLLAHGYILACAFFARMRLDDVLWLYWCAVLVLVASMARRMRRSPRMPRADSAVLLGIFVVAQGWVARLLVDDGHLPRATPDLAIGVVFLVASGVLDLRRQLAFDELESPDLLHFLGLWMAKSFPFALLYAVPEMLADSFLRGSAARLLGFLWAIASIDVLLHLLGPSFGRTLTVWQQKRKTKSSDNYLKWYKPEEWKDR